MKTLMLLSLSLAVALGTPILPSGVEQLPAKGEKHQSPLLGDRVPVQGHVVVENPAPQVILDSPEQQGKMAPMDLKPKESMAENEIKEEPTVKEEANVKVENKANAEQEVEPQPDVPAEAEAEIMPEIEKELQAEPDYKVESEVKVEPEFQIDPEEKPELQKDQERFQIDREIDLESVIEERQIEPVMELEILDDDSMFGNKEHHKELSVEEMSLKKEDFVAELLPEEEEEEKEDEVEEEDEEELLRKNNALDDRPVVELEPEMIDEPLQNTVDMSDAAVLSEETSLEMMEQQMMPQSENNLPDEEAEMEMTASDQPMQFFEEPAMEDENLQFDFDQQALMKEDPHRQERRSCPNITEDGKCYLFFQKAKNYGDAEFFCQEQFPGGHLASITSQHIHRRLMNLILMQYGAYTRTWVGGRRLDKNRFIWLDGSPWSYEDWLSGEPNNTSGVEDCVEVLAWGNGKFNDFTCGEPQAFICSYPV